MTKAELIKMLAPYPDDVPIEAWDPECKEFMPVTGCALTPERMWGGSKYLAHIRLYTDDA